MENEMKKLFTELELVHEKLLNRHSSELKEIDEQILKLQRKRTELRNSLFCQAIASVEKEHEKNSKEE